MSDYFDPVRVRPTPMYCPACLRELGAGYVSMPCCDNALRVLLEARAKSHAHAREVLHYGEWANDPKPAPHPSLHRRIVNAWRWYDSIRVPIWLVTLLAVAALIAWMVFG